MDGSFGRRLVAAGLISEGQLEECLELARELDDAGLGLGLPELVMRLGRVDPATSRSIWQAGGGGPLVDPPGPDPDRDRIAAAKALRAGALTRDDLERIEEFRRWALDRGLQIGLAEVLLRRGYLTVEDLEAAAAPPPPLPRRSAPARPSRPSSPRRQPPAGRDRSRALLVAGVIAGAAIPLATGAFAIGRILGDGEDPLPATSSPPAPAATEEAPVAFRRSEAELDLDLQTLRERYAARLDRRDWDEAIREVEAFARGLPDDRSRARFARELENMKTFVDSARAPSGDLFDDIRHWKLVNTGPGSRAQDGEILLLPSGSRLMSQIETRTLSPGRRFRLAFEFSYRNDPAEEVAFFLFFETDPDDGEQARALAVLAESTPAGRLLGFARQMPGRSWNIDRHARLPEGSLSAGRWHRFEMTWDEGSGRLVASVDAAARLELTLAAGERFLPPWGIGMSAFREFRLRRLDLEPR